MKSLVNPRAQDPLGLAQTPDPLTPGSQHLLTPAADTIQLPWGVRVSFSCSGQWEWGGQLQGPLGSPQADSYGEAQRGGA